MTRLRHGAPIPAAEGPPRRDEPTAEEELDPRVQRFLRFMAATAIRSLMREREATSVQSQNGAVESDEKEP